MVLSLISLMIPNVTVLFSCVLMGHVSQPDVPLQVPDASVSSLSDNYIALSISIPKVGAPITINAGD